MLAVTGSAHFIEEGKKLELQIRIQAQFPSEHELLERIGASEANTSQMECGCLIWTTDLDGAAAPESWLGKFLPNSGKLRLRSEQ